MTPITDEMIDTMLGNPQAVAALQGVATELGKLTPVGDMSRDEVRALIATVVARQQAAETVQRPEIPEEMIDQILADPEAVAALQHLAKENGVTTPVGEMPRPAQKALIENMMAIAQQAQAAGLAGAASGEGSDGAAELPPGLVDQVFGDPRAQELLKKIMADNKLDGEPGDLPMEMKTAIVRMLVEQGVISFGTAPHDA